MLDRFYKYPTFVLEVWESGQWEPDLVVDQISCLIWATDALFSFTTGIVNTIFSVSNSLPARSLLGQICSLLLPCLLLLGSSFTRIFSALSVFISWTFISLLWDLTLSYVGYTIHKPTVLKLMGSAQFLLPNFGLVAESLLDITLRHAVGTWNWTRCISKLLIFPKNLPYLQPSPSL